MYTSYENRMAPSLHNLRDRAGRLKHEAEQLEQDLADAINVRRPRIARAKPRYPVVDRMQAVEGSTGHRYYLGTSRLGNKTCTCPDYLFRQGPRGEVCKHILANTRNG